MRNLIFIIVIVTAISCNEETYLADSLKEETFSLRGTTNGMENGTVIYLDNLLENSIMDSAIVENEVFVFSGKLLKSPLQALLYTKDYSNYRFLWLEGKTMNFNGSNTDFRNAIVTGSETENLRQSLDKRIDTLSRDERMAKEIEFVENNPNSIVSAYILSVYTSTWGRKETQRLFNQFSSENKESEYGGKIARYLEQNEEPIIHYESQAKVPKVLLGSWLDEDGIYRVEIQKDFCGINNQLWTYHKVEKKGGAYILDIISADDQRWQFIIAINSEGKGVLKDPYLKRTHFISSKAFTRDFREIVVNDLPSTLFGSWKTPNDSLVKVKVDIDGVRKNGELWAFHQIMWVEGEYRITLKHENSFLLWLPRWKGEGSLSDPFTPDQVMQRADLTADRRSQLSENPFLTKSLNNDLVFNVPKEINTTKIPSKFIRNWHTRDGASIFEIGKETIEIDEKLWKIRKITLINGKYQLQLQHRPSEAKGVEIRLMTLRFVTDDWVEVTYSGQFYELYYVPNYGRFSSSESDKIHPEILGFWFSITKDERYNIDIDSTGMIWRGNRIPFLQIVKKEDIYYFFCGLNNRFHMFKVSILKNGSLQIRSDGETELFSRHSQRPFFSKQAWQVIGTIGFLSFLLLAISRWRALQKQKEESRKHRELELELKALRSQMNPHFLFNSLSSIQNLINKQDPEQANLYLSKFSRILRSVLNNSESPLISLEAEIELLTLYCDLEALRFNFDYEIEVPSSLDIHQWEIPVMLIQPFVENAIHHGIGPSDKNGKLKISFSESNEQLQCTIVDNGVGINFSQSIKGAEKIGKKNFGIRVAEERVKMINKKYSDSLKLEIIDISNNSPGNTGTQVDLILSSGFN